MTRRASVVSDFTGGEVTKRAFMRADASFFRSALETCKNFLIRPQGGTVMRGPFVFQDGPGGGILDNDCRLIPFRSGDGEDWLIVLAPGAPGVGFVYLWNQAGYLAAMPNAAGGNVTHPYEAAELDAIEYAQNGQRIVLMHENHIPLWLDAPETIDATNGWVFEPQPWATIPWITVDDTGAPVPATSTWRFVYIGSWVYHNLIVLVNGVPVATNYRKRKSDPAIFGIQFDNSGTAFANNRNAAAVQRMLGESRELNAADVTVTYISGGGGGLEILVSGPNSDADISVTSYDFWQNGTGPTMIVDAANPPVIAAGESEPAWSFPYTVQRGSNYYECLQSHTSNAANDEPGVGANWTDYWNDIGTAAPLAWQAAWQHPGGIPAWADATDYPKWGRGFPRVGTFYQQRSVLGSTPNLPTRFWGSRINQFKRFNGSGSQDNDPYAYDLATKDAARIQWMTELQGLIMGTTSGDWNIPVDITPSNIDADRTTGRRSQQVRPLVIGPEVFYVEQGGKRLRRRIRNRDIEGWLSEDFSLLAEHIASRGIVRLAVQYVPETFIWMLLDDGQLACVSYNQELRMAAWSDIEINGTAYDIVVAHGPDGQDYVWAVIDFGNGKHPYYMGFPDGTEPFLDGYGPVTADLVGPQLVSAPSITNGGPARSLHRDTGGEWEFLEDGTGLTGAMMADSDKDEIIAGIPFDGTLKTLERAGDGGGFPSKRRWSDLYVRLLNCFRPIVNGQVPRDTATRVSEDLEVNTLGNQGKGAVTIVQDKGLHTELVGLFGHLGEGRD